MHRLVVTLAVALAWMGPCSEATQAESPTLRNLPAAGIHDAGFGRPNRLKGFVRGGYVQESPHFSIVADNRADATWAAEEMERAWTGVSRLADQWTEAHRRLDLDQGLLGVVVTRQTLHPQRRSGSDQYPGSATPEIYVNLSDGKLSLEDRLPQVRAATLAAMLYLTGQDEVLPAWVQMGLAAYVSGQPAAEPTLTRLDPPGPFVPPTKDHWPWRTEARFGSNLAIPGDQAYQAALWVRYLLEGDDATHADQFFKALATAVAEGSRSVMSSTQKARAVPPRAIARTPQSALTLETLTGQTVSTGDVSDWLADRNVGQPIVQPTPEEMPLDERHREMLVILKLARRMALEAGEATASMKVVERGMDRTEELAGEDEPRPAVAVDALYERLTDPQQPRWATIDTNGRLLLSSDADRLAAIFTNPDITYRTYQREGHWVLEAAFASGEVVEGWLEENPTNPKRPIAHLQAKAAEPAVESQAAR